MCGEAEKPQLEQSGLPEAPYHCGVRQTDVPARRARPTLRCLEEDLGIPLPDLTIDLGEVDHPLLKETRRVAPESPKGQKRILSIPEPLVYRIRHSGFRGATWLDEPTGVVWLCAVERREQDSDDDAFAHFLKLHESGRLLPSDADRLRDRTEGALRLFNRLARELLDELAAAMAAPAKERAPTLNGLPARSSPGPCPQGSHGELVRPVNGRRRQPGCPGPAPRPAVRPSSGGDAAGGLGDPSRLAFRGRALVRGRGARYQGAVTGGPATLRTASTGSLSR